MKFSLVGTLCLLLLLLLFPDADAQREKSPWALSNPPWAEPVEPFRIAGNLYYVGPKGLAVFLLTTEEGHILIDGGLPGYEAQIAASIEALGYKMSDIRLLLNTHAHFDHSGGLAKIKEQTGASLHAMQGDVSALEGGFYLGSEELEAFSSPPVKVDSILHDGDEVRLGDTVLTARLTAGHSRGCTSWWISLEEGGETLETLIFCSATVAANRLVGPPQYDGIVEDYRRTFDVTADWRPDIFLANHPGFSSLFAEQKKAAAGDPEAWRNGEMFTRMMQRLEQEFEHSLEKQSRAAQE